MQPEALPDRVMLKSGGSSQQLSLHEFLKIELAKQIEFLLKGDVTFFKGFEQLQTIEALKVLRTVNAKQR